MAAATTLDDKKPVWLDCDPGHDDAIALLLAVHLPNIELLGVSTSASNAPVLQTTLNAARFLHASGLPSSSKLKVFPGCERPFLRPARHDPEIHGSDGLGGVEGLPANDDTRVKKLVNASTDPGEALLGLREAVLRCREGGKDLTLIITGAQSLPALFVLSYPSLIGPGKGIGEIVFMGGAAGVYGNRGPTAEFNILLDPEAAQVVCDAECKVVMIGLNVTHTAIWHDDLHQHLLDPRRTPSPSSPPPTSAATPLRHTLSTLFAFFAASYRSAFGSLNFPRGPPIHDALTLIYVARPELFEGTRYRVEVERTGRCVGCTVVDVFGDRDREFPDDKVWGRGGKNVWVAESFDVSEGWRMLLRAIHEAEKVSPLNDSVDVPDWVDPPDSVVHP